MASILLLVDMQHLWDSCRAQFGKRARVDFKGLIDKAKKKKTDVVLPVAFVTNQSDKNQDNLVKKLEEFGFSVVTKNTTEQDVDFVDEMMAWLESNLDHVDTIAIGGGKAEITPVVDAANAANKNTLLIGFSVGVSKEAACAADDIKLLSKNETISQ